MKKLLTTKFYNLSRSTTFILVVSPSEIVEKIQIYCVAPIFKGGWKFNGGRKPPLQMQF